MIEARNLTKKYGDKTAVDDLTFTVRPGIVTGFLGPNGAGKSSMLNIISGFYTPSDGEIWYKGSRRPSMKPYEVARMGVARTFQNIALFEGMTVLDNVMTGRLTHMNAGLLSQALWWGKARREEVANREIVEKGLPDSVFLTQKPLEPETAGL